MPVLNTTSPATETGAPCSRPAMAVPSSRTSWAFMDVVKLARPMVRGVESTRSERTRFPERVVGGEQLGRLVAPLELVLHAPAAKLAHCLALRRVVEQIDDPGGEVHRVVALRVKRGFLRGEAALGQVELHDRLAE